MSVLYNCQSVSIFSNGNTDILLSTECIPYYINCMIRDIYHSGEENLEKLYAYLNVTSMSNQTETLNCFNQP